MTEAAHRPHSASNAVTGDGQPDRGPSGGGRNEIEGSDGAVGDVESGETAIEAAVDMSAGPGAAESAVKDEEDRKGEKLATHHKNGLQDQTNYMCVELIQRACAIEVGS